MTVSVISRKDAVSTTWSGGTTTEFYLFPRDGSYKERRFDLRISSATVDLEASDFTLLPDYHRIITPLEGGFTLTYKETGEKVTLAPLEEDFFDGAYHTHSIGKAIDFNVMYKKGMHAAYSVINASIKFGLADFRFLYVPFIDAKDLTGSTLNEHSLTRDTLYVSDDGSDAFVLALKKPVSLIYVSVRKA